MSSNKLTWLGHGTFLFESSSGVRIVFDPWMEENPSYPKEFDIGRVDLILVTHGHFDHIASTPKLWEKDKPKVIGIFELCNWLEKKGVTNTVPMNKGGTINELDIDITMVHADHSCGITDDDGSIVYGGEAVGFVLDVDSSLRLYFAGDTNIFESMKLIRRLYAPNVACLPIGDRFTMGPQEAAEAAKMLEISTLIPMHFGTFPDLTGTPAAVNDLLEGSNTKLVIPEVGVPISIGEE